jgi:hypothetical protein
MEFVLSRDGTVRFSDFSLRVAKEFLQRVGMPLEYKLHPDLNGMVKIRFKPDDLTASGLDDLSLLGELALEGEVDIHAVSGTRRMELELVPDYARVLINLDVSDRALSPAPVDSKQVPCLILLKHPGRLGRVILFSCHFAEMQNVKGVDPDRVASAIRLRQGELAAASFLERIAMAKRMGRAEDVGRMASGAVGGLMSSASASPGGY